MDERVEERVSVPRSEIRGRDAGRGDVRVQSGAKR